MWDSFDPESITSLFNPETGLEIRIGIFDIKRNLLKKFFVDLLTNKGKRKFMGVYSRTPRFLVDLVNRPLIYSKLPMYIAKFLPNFDKLIYTPKYFSFYNSNFAWESIDHLGDHATNGEYGELKWHFKKGHYSLEWYVEESDVLFINITPEDSENQFIAVETFFPWKEHTINVEEDQITTEEITIESNRPNAFCVALENRQKIEKFLRKNPGKYPSINRIGLQVFPARDKLMLIAKKTTDLRFKKSFSEMEKNLLQARGKYLERRVSLQSENVSNGAAEACLKAISWNNIYDPFKERIFTPVSRRWSVVFGGWCLFVWDTFFAALISSIEDRKLARQNILAILDEATENGFLPNYSCWQPYRKSEDRSQPPVGSYISLKIFHEDREFLAKIYPKLK